VVFYTHNDMPRHVGLTIIEPPRRSALVTYLLSIELSRLDLSEVSSSRVCKLCVLNQMNSNIAGEDVPKDAMHSSDKKLYAASSKRPARCCMVQVSMMPMNITPSRNRLKGYNAVRTPI
jgi:hypothetical protein